MHPFEDSAALLSDGPALAARMARDGYLYLPGLLPVDVVARVQREVAAITREAGWLRPDTPLAAAVADPGGFCVDPEPRYLVVLRRINRLERYHSLKHHPALLGLFERMLGAFDAKETAAFEDYLRRCIVALDGDPVTIVQEPPRHRAERRWRRGAAG